MKRYEVVVSGVGTVYLGDDETEAQLSAYSWAERVSTSGEDFIQRSKWEGETVSAYENDILIFTHSGRKPVLC